jgi:hypothetical protein
MTLVKLQQDEASPVMQKVWDSLVNHETVGETGKIEVQHHQNISTTKTLPYSKSLIKHP